MPYIDESWTDEQKALVMADEALQCIFESYNALAIKSKHLNPDERATLLKFKFSASHATAVRELCVRPAVSKEIWSIVDVDKKKHDTELIELMKEM